MEIPATFDESFLLWFRERTERAWEHDIPVTRWLPGLTDAEIEEIEQRWAVRFPPDYRLFLQRLHAIGQVVAGAGNKRKRLAPIPHSKVVYNWQLDKKALKAAFEWPLVGVLPKRAVDVRPQSVSLAEAQRRVRAEVAAAPKLIPLAGHRYLVGEPCRAGNPVLSVYGTDIIPYGKDLRGFLLIEFAGLLGLDFDLMGRRYGVPSRETLVTIPFWGEFFA